MINNHSEVHIPTKKGPCVDFSYQFNIARERAEKRIYGMLCSLSERMYQANKRIGILIILGSFDRYPDYSIPGMRQIGNNNIQKYLNIAFGQFEAEVEKILESGDDGAIIINHNGQILGTGIYLVVEDASLEIPDGAGTRHITAASFSTREDVISAFTMSEETLVVRMWKDGAFTEQFKPDEKED